MFNKSIISDWTDMLNLRNKKTQEKNEINLNDLFQIESLESCKTFKDIPVENGIAASGVLMASNIWNDYVFSEYIGIFDLKNIFLLKDEYNIILNESSYHGSGWVRIYLKSKDSSHIIGVSFYNKDNTGACNLYAFYTGKNYQFYKKQLEKIIVLKREESTENNIHLISIENSSLRLIDFPVKQYETNLSLNYGEEFLTIDRRISEFLENEDKTGLILLHSAPGNGKTHYIRSLISRLKGKKIYIPSDMVHSLSSPNFISFMRDNKNSIIIVEDAEEIIKSREQVSAPSAVSNLLNLTDGLLGDILSLRFICTFNCPLENIDPALLRKGRLELKYEFKPLPPDEANLLLKHLNKDFITKQSMSLAEIYNVNSDNGGKDEERKALGFKMY